MPKILENVKEQLIAEAKRQIREQGYSSTTIRSVAAACGLGVGTVYNYFPSKDMLIAASVLDDWMKYLEKMAALPADEPKKLLGGIYKLLQEFARENELLFQNAEASKSANTVYLERHKMLRGQIASFIVPICENRQSVNPSFTAEFIAESLLCWFMENVDFEDIFPLLEKILSNDRG